jgi:hypothetical protein
LHFSLGRIPLAAIGFVFYSPSFPSSDRISCFTYT